MMAWQQAVITIVIIAICTLITRALPFWLFSGERAAPRFLPYLGSALPYAVIGMLIIYCLRDFSFAQPSRALSQGIGVAVTAALYLWRKHSLIAIVGGTAAYMLALRIFT
ncbi:MAG: AzlD domain-containing protein [Oscillospiraceae bacterium]|jgi:branched-subunit amino acid transport protein AzlD|nr:AzlD domain-containing protein [Oscillospiraceae bacterium]